MVRSDRPRSDEVESRREERMTELLIDGTSKQVQFIFAHGAGAPMDSAFMNDVARGLATRGIEVVRFEFPYMASRRRGERRPPDREGTLRKCWHEVLEQRRDSRRLLIGGKSMGGRYATMVADEEAVDGVVCFGYPFHPPDKPQQLRVAHLAELRTPSLFVQGTRDALGNRDEVGEYTLSSNIQMAWIEEGDHSLKPKARSGRTSRQNVDEAIELAARFILRGSPTK